MPEKDKTMTSPNVKRIFSNMESNEVSERSCEVGRYSDRTEIIREIKEKLFSTKTSSEKMDEELRNTLQKIREERFKKLHQSQTEETVLKISEEEMQKISELADYIAEYVRKVGKEQAVFDFQVGLNLLNNYKKESIVEEKIQLKEDADFGEKTFASLLNILSVYPVDIVKWFVKLGAINNQIWNTNENKKINSDKKVEQVGNELLERRI